MSLTCFWYAPTHGDSRFIATKTPEFPGTPAYLIENAQRAERSGFDGILVPAGPTCSDAFITGTHIAVETQTLRPLVAVRPGTFGPTSVAKMAATLDHISQGRLNLNIVTGGSPLELAMDGDFLVHDERYRRTDEFLEVLKAVWAADDVSHAGRYFQIKGATLRPRPLQTPHPRLYLGGASDLAIETAVRHVDGYLMWGEPVEAVRQQISNVRQVATAAGRGAHSLSFGLRITLLVEETDRAAWARAEEILSAIDPTTQGKVARYLNDADSVALSRIQALAGQETSDPCFWTGMVRYRSGNSTVLVGSVDSVATSLRAYIDAGVREFIFSSYPHRDSVSFIGERLLPLLRTWEQTSQG
jgi:alkanesulfonate monooxygenase